MAHSLGNYFGFILESFTEWVNVLCHSKSPFKAVLLVLEEEEEEEKEEEEEEKEEGEGMS